MADVEVKQKKRKISDVFKKKNKENKEELLEVFEDLDVKETEGKTAKGTEEKEDAGNADVQDSHERKKKKFGHRRFLSSRKKKSKKQLVHEEKSEAQRPHVVKGESLMLDSDKIGQLEAKQQEPQQEQRQEFVEEKGNEESEKDNNAEFRSEVQNVQLKCESPECVFQSDGKEATAETMASNVNENNKQLNNGVLLKKEREGTEDGSVLRGLLIDERHDIECTSDSTKQGQERSESNEVGKLLPNIFIANFLDIMIPGSKSKSIGNPPNTKPETLYELVLQTADQTYSTLVNLINAFLARAGQIPKQALVNFLVYLIKKYPQCFKIKKVKRRAVLSDGHVPVDTVQ